MRMLPSLHQSVWRKYYLVFSTKIYCFQWPLPLTFLASQNWVGVVDRWHWPLSYLASWNEVVEVVKWPWPLTYLAFPDWVGVAGRCGWTSGSPDVSVSPDWVHSPGTWPARDTWVQWCWQTCRRHQGLGVVAVPVACEPSADLFFQSAKSTRSRLNMNCI